MQLPVKHLGKNVSSRARLPCKSERHRRLPLASVTSRGGAAWSTLNGDSSNDGNAEGISEVCGVEAQKSRVAAKNAEKAVFITGLLRLQIGARCQAAEDYSKQVADPVINPICSFKNGDWARGHRR